MLIMMMRLRLGVVVVALKIRHAPLTNMDEWDE
jgi:hypothetical protein